MLTTINQEIITKMRRQNSINKLKIRLIVEIKKKTRKKAMKTKGKMVKKIKRMKKKRKREHTQTEYLSMQCTLWM